MNEESYCGTSLYFQGKRARKTQPATGFDVACKWQRNYGAWQVDEAWFILRVSSSNLV
jgi:hypothetical protein